MESKSKLTFLLGAVKLGSYGIAAVLIAAVLCGLQRWFREDLQRWLKIDVEENQRSAMFRSAERNESPSIIVQGIDGRLRDSARVFCLPRIPTTSLSHTRLNDGNVTRDTVSVVNHFSGVQFSNHSLMLSQLSTSFQGTGLAQIQRGIPQHGRMGHMMLLPENMNNISLSRNRLDTSQRINRIFGSRTNRDTDSNGDKNSICHILLRILYFCLMSVYLYDFCADAVLSSQYFVRGEIKDFILLIAPGTTSALVSIIIIHCIATTHISMSCCFVFLVFVTSPITKALIYGWMVNTGEPSWYKHWYFHVLTFLQLVEVCIEGIPQLIFEYYIILTENQTVYQSIQSLQWWYMTISTVAVLCSITSVTITLDREEDTRKVLKNRVNRQIDKEYYWENYKDQNNGYWYFYCVVVFIGRALEFLPRCVIYATFAKVFGLKVFGCVMAMYAVFLSIISMFCFRNVHSNDKSSLFLISSLISVIANLFYCYEWSFRFLWKKEILYPRYFLLFYAVNMALCIANISFLCGIIVYLPITAILQQCFLFLRIRLRQKMTAGLMRILNR